MDYESYLDELEKAAAYASAIIDTKDHILSEANRVVDQILKGIDKNEYLVLDKTPASIIAPDCEIVIISYTDVQTLANKIADGLLESDYKSKDNLFRPITMMAKLSNQEYAIDGNGTRLVHIIKVNQMFDLHIAVAQMIANEMFGPKHIISLHSPTDDTNPTKDSLSVLKLILDESKLSYPKKHLQSDKLRSGFVSKVKSLLKATSDPNGMICMVEKDDDSYAAVDCIYAQTQTKDTFIDTCRAAYADLMYQSKKLSESYDFKFIVIHNVDAPGDFRLKKYMIMLERKRSAKTKGQDKIYLFNLYGTATYDIVPIVARPKESYLSAHPIVVLRFILLSLSSVYKAYKKTNSKYLEKLAGEYLLSALSILKDSTNGYNPNTIVWYGYNKDEDYDKIKYNQFHRQEGEQYRLLH